MSLSHLLVDAIQAEREIQIATRRLATQLTTAQAENTLRNARPANRLRRLLLAI